MHCKHCGRLIPDDSKFCIHCGGNVEISISTPPEKTIQSIVETKEQQIETNKETYSQENTENSYYPENNTNNQNSNQIFIIGSVNFGIVLFWFLINKLVTNTYDYLKFWQVIDMISFMSIPTLCLLFVKKTQYRIILGVFALLMLIYQIYYKFII